MSSFCVSFWQGCRTPSCCTASSVQPGNDRPEEILEKLISDLSMVCGCLCVIQTRRDASYWHDIHPSTPCMLTLPSCLICQPPRPKRTRGCRQFIFALVLSGSGPCLPPDAPAVPAGWLGHQQQAGGKLYRSARACL